MSEKKEKKLLGIIIVLMTITLIIMCAVLVTGVRRVGQGTFPSSLTSFLSARRERGPLPLSDAGLIRSWMTFDYINKLFNLSPTYLKTTFSISDSRYPNLSLSEYDESFSTTSPVSFLSDVKTAILQSTTTQQ